MTMTPEDYAELNRFAEKFGLDYQGVQYDFIKQEYIKI